MEHEHKPFIPTYRRLKFCQAFTRIGNATAAALEAGYTGKSVGLNAVRLLKEESIRRYILKITEQLDEDLKLTLIARQTELAEMFFGRVMDKIAIDGGVMEVPMRMVDRLRAGELLAKMRGELIEKKEIKQHINMKVDRIESVIVDPVFALEILHEHE